MKTIAPQSPAAPVDNAERKAARDAGRIRKANRTGRVFVCILGNGSKGPKLTPSARPITLSATYDLEREQPESVAAKLAYRHGTMAATNHFTTVAVYDVADKVKADHQFSRVTVLRCDHPMEKATRERLAITDAMCDPFGPGESPSWYLTRVSN